MVRALVSTLSIALLLAGCGVNTGATLSRAGSFQALKAKAAPAVSAENFRQVNADLYRMGLPTDADMETLAKMGVKTDITLMSSFGDEAGLVAHETEVAKKLGMEVLHLPLPFKTLLPTEMVKAYFDVFKDPARLPAVVHCRHGRDRTGTMVAIYRIQNDRWTNAKAYEEMQSFGFKEARYPLFAQFVKTFGRPGAESTMRAAFPLATVDMSMGWNAAE